MDKKNRMEVPGAPGGVVKRKPRLLFISHSGNLYGSERSLLSLLSGLKAIDEYELLCFVPRAGEFTKALDDAGVPYIVIPFERWIGYRFHWAARYYRRIRNHWLLPAIIREAASWKPDLVYTNTIATSAGAIITENLPERPVHIWHARELPGNRAYHFGMFDHGGNRAFRTIATTSDYIICNSHFLLGKLKPLLEKELKRTPGKYANQFNIEVVYNGFDRECLNTDILAKWKKSDTSRINSPDMGPVFPESGGFPAEMRTGIKNVPPHNTDSFNIVMAGGISAVKNYGEAIPGVKKLLDDGFPVTLDIYGSGPDIEIRKLVKQIADYNLQDHIKIRGYHKNMTEMYQEADLLLVTSKMETFGRVAVEAMLAGCPVLCSDAGALPEIIRDGDTGLLYRSGDPENLFSQLKKLVSDAKLREQLSIKAAIYATNNYSLDTFIHKIHSIIRNLLQDKSSETATSTSLMNTGL